MTNQKSNFIPSTLEKKFTPGTLVSLKSYIQDYRKLYSVGIITLDNQSNSVNHVWVCWQSISDGVDTTYEHVANLDILE